MVVTCATYAYPRLSTAARGALASQLADLGQIPGAYVLSTCVRIEIAAPVPPESLLHDLSNLLAPGTAPEPEVRSGGEAVLHLFRVAAGLESPIVGEREILSQFRRTLTEAADAGAIDGQFTRLLQSAVGSGRRARELMPAQPHDSMGAIAAGLVADDNRVTILGAGEMAMAVLRSLAARPTPPQVTLLARRPQYVAVSSADVWPFDRLDEVLAGHPTVISATSATSRLLSESHLAEVLRYRPEPLKLIDMAMPPDFEPPRDAAITHYDIDDLARIADTGPRSAEADVVVAEAAAKAYSRFIGQSEIGPLISRLISDADAIVESTIARFGSKLATPEDHAILRQVAHTVARAIMARPVSHLNRVDIDAAEVEAIAQAFRPARG